MIKQFLSFAETAKELETDDEGLRQAIEFSLEREFLPMYVRADEKPFLATLVGINVDKFGTASISNGANIATKEQVEGAEFDYSDLGDSLSRIFLFQVHSRQLPNENETRYSARLVLSGFFRVFQKSARELARTKKRSVLAIAPASWWANHALVPRNSSGKPEWHLDVDNLESRWAPVPEIFETYFSATDVRQAKAQPNYQSQTRSREHISDRLTTLNQAAEKWWANASKTDRATHPKNDVVAAWLVQRGFSTTLAEKAASIIRPEWAPTGRKPEE